MAPLSATVVEVGKLLEAAGASLAGTLALTLAFSLLIRGASRFAEYQREGRSIAAAANGALAVVGLLVCLGAVVAALVVMTAK